MSDLPLAGRKAIIVGFADESGREIVRALAEAGADVAAAASSMDGEEVMEAKRAAKDVAKLGRATFSQAWDVTLPTNVQVSLKQLIKEFGHPDILVYNVTASLEKPFARTTDAELAHVHATLLLGAFYAARSFVRELPEGRTGDIVFVHHPGAANAATAAAAAGVRGLEAALREELTGRVRVHGLSRAAGTDGGREILNLLSPADGSA